MFGLTHLPTLQNFHIEESRKPSTKLEPKVGPVVLLQDQNSPRIQGKMEIIQELHPGENNLVRTVSVRYPNRKIVKRFNNMLTPLELHASATSDSTEQKNNEQSQDYER